MPTSSIPINADTISAYASGAQLQASFPETTLRGTPLARVYPGLAPLPALSRVEKLPNHIPIENIQSGIFIGEGKQLELFHFFHINDVADFKDIFKTKIIPLVTSTRTLLAPPEDQPDAYLNVSFSATGLAALDITDNIGDTFTNGQYADANSLGDDTAIWEPAFAGKSIHGVFLIGSDDLYHIDTLQNTITTSLGASITTSITLKGNTRPGLEAGHEHFGYLDGISNPAVIGFTHPKDVLPGQSFIKPGIILARRDGDDQIGTPTRPDWTLDGSFLVFRKLQQFVPEFEQYCMDHALPGGTQKEGAELLGARMVGRWKSGAPTELCPSKDDPELGGDPKRNNNFDFSIAEDQSRCPFSAHIRKMRPRADLENKNTVNQAIRSGIPYGDEVTPLEKQVRKTFCDRGLAFVEYQSQIEKGFRLQQKAWANDPTFIWGKDVEPGFDPIIGQEGVSLEPVIVNGLDPHAQTTPLIIPRYVRALGGEYFFTPSISALKDKISAHSAAIGRFCN